MPNWGKVATLAVMAVAIVFLVTRPASGSGDTTPAASPSAQATAVGAGSATITLNIVRPATAESVVFTGPARVIESERSKLDHLATSGLLPTGESESVLDGDQHQGSYVCSATTGSITFTIYGTGLSSSTCKDLSALAQDHTSPSP